MNIFVTDLNPVLAATPLPDKLLVKMVLESTQIAATAMSEKYLNLGFLTKKDGTPYRPTHIHHPCVKWAGSSIHNLKWLTEHGIALAEEYTKRYGKVHACESPLRVADSVLSCLGASADKHDTFVLAMPDEYKSPDPVISYRRYLHTKAYSAWNKDPESTPVWWDSKLHKEITTIV